MLSLRRLNGWRFWQRRLPAREPRLPECELIQEQRPAAAGLGTVISACTVSVRTSLTRVTQLTWAIPAEKWTSNLLCSPNRGAFSATPRPHILWRQQSKRKVSRRVLSRPAEQRINSLPPVIENPAHVSANFQRVNNPAENTESHRVLHFVYHFCSAPVRLKPVRVTPYLIWPLCLLVDETMRRIPLPDKRPPVDGYAMQSQPIADCGPFLN